MKTCHCEACRDRRRSIRENYARVRGCLSNAAICKRAAIRYDVSAANRCNVADRYYAGEMVGSEAKQRAVHEWRMVWTCLEQAALHRRIARGFLHWDPHHGEGDMRRIDIDGGAEFIKRTTAAERETGFALATGRVLGPEKT